MAINMTLIAQTRWNWTFKRCALDSAAYSRNQDWLTHSLTSHTKDRIVKKKAEKQLQVPEFRESSNKFWELAGEMVIRSPPESKKKSWNELRG
ncbi:hypothetical protein LINGRAHAP2_LOCUS2014 [Linum grandiflorum]